VDGTRQVPIASTGATLVRRWTVGLAGLLALGGAACGAEPRVPDDAGWATIRVSGRALLTNAPILIADGEGYFADERLRIEWSESSQSTAQAIPVLAQGKLDVLGAMVSSGLLNAIASGAPVRIVADKGHIAPGSCRSSAVVARRGDDASAEIRTLSDLRGRRVVLNDVGVAGYYTAQLFASAGVPLDDVTIVKMPYPGIADALRSGAVDAASVPEPWITRLVDEGHRVVGSAEDVVPRLQSAVVVYGPTLLGDRRDVGERFMRAYLRGVAQYARGKTDRNLAILADRLGFDRALLSRICWQAIRRDGAVDTASVRAFQEWALGNGYLARAVTREAFWDPSFVRQALAVASGTGAVP
jgi:NitT/TauT family transport system substrate-binding protein